MEGITVDLSSSGIRTVTVTEYDDNGNKILEKRTKTRLSGGSSYTEIAFNENGDAELVKDIRTRIDGSKDIIERAVGTNGISWKKSKIRPTFLSPKTKPAELRS